MESTHVPTTHVLNSSELTPMGSRFPITNRLLNRYQTPHSQPSLPRLVDATNYRECLRNHAAPRGGLLLDGCGGYIAPYTSDPSNPVYMKCMVCGCHRNFHRMEKDVPVATPENGSVHHFGHHLHAPPRSMTRAGQLISPSSAPPSSFFLTYYPPPHGMVVNGAGAYPENGPADNNQSAQEEAGISNGTKRRRTRFSREQKVKMQELAEKIEWKIKKGEERLIEAHCNEIGIQTTVFKVWLNNNKCNLGKKNAAITTTTISPQ